MISIRVDDAAKAIAALLKHFTHQQLKTALEEISVYS
jgi:hypothetical protein